MNQFPSSTLDRILAPWRVENAAQVKILRPWISRTLTMCRKIAIHVKRIPIGSNIATIEGSPGGSLEYKQVLEYKTSFSYGPIQVMIEQICN